ncbi:hypothetical protein ACTXOR_02325 [Arthrobacter rhombi]|uniref:hypothetical protein n=1 Tax=Arthrobacter rhombi TaxID=71253 RepID=UPI003FD4C000
MITMHDGNCEPFTINRLTGREVNRSAWNVKPGQLGEPRLEQPIVGWRLAVLAQQEGEIVHLSDFQSRQNSIFGPDVPTLPPAICDKKWMIGTPAITDYDKTPHTAPGEECQCGYRIVHDLGDLTEYMRHMQLPDAEDDGIRPAFAVVPVIGAGLTAACDFKTYREPGLTVRVQHVALEGHAYIDSTRKDLGPALQKLGMQTTWVNNLADAHAPNRCGLAPATPYMSYTDWISTQ